MCVCVCNRSVSERRERDKAKVKGGVKGCDASSELNDFSTEFKQRIEAVPGGQGGHGWVFQKTHKTK